MSEMKNLIVDCPKCTAKIPVTIWTSINVTLNPELKSKVLEKRINIFSCSPCEYAAPIGVDLLYHDMSQKFMVWLKDPDASGRGSVDSDAEAQAKGMAKHGYKFRLSTSFTQLIEIIRIFDDGLDDRVLEIMKSQIEPYIAGYPGPSSRLYYMRRTMNNNEIQVSFYLPALGNALMTPSPEISYSKYERDYGRFFSLIHEASHWMSVDRNFSKEIERLKQSVGPSPEGNQNKSQRGIWGRLFG
jgi:hypothetical protein